MAYWRNIFRSEDENSEWAEILRQFPNQVPRFTSAEDCIAFLKKHCQTGSNPKEPLLRHSVSTLTDWQQISQILFPKIDLYRATLRSTSSSSPQDNDDKSKAPPSNAMYDYIESRLNLPVHSFLTKYSVENTFKYLYFHMRCGIYVMIRNKQVAIFCPFVNKDYTNTWGDELSVEYDTVESYYAEKLRYFRQENYLIDKTKWWANGNIICNWEADSLLSPGCHHWGDQFLLQVKDMLAETCRLRDVSDCEFFVNKRDYPQLKYHMGSDSEGYPVEPYGFIFDKDDRDPVSDIALQEHHYRTYAPILSFYTSNRFSDIPLPPSEDWEAATGEMFPVTFSSSVGEDGNLIVSPPRELFTKDNLLKFDCSWESKTPTAFFRGTATGGGITPETNQRLHLAQLSYEWTQRGEVVSKLDAKITGWNSRDKKIAGAKMNFIVPTSLPFKGGKENYVEIYKQSSFKYIIYAEGHCAACRYGFMMLLGSVILKVDSQCVADQLWYFPMLRPWYDHVPVRADLSDLEEKIDWCRANDDQCKEIAKNARCVYDQYISRDGILDYLQVVLKGISQRWHAAPTWATPVPVARDPPTSRAVGTSLVCCSDGLCGYCEARYQQKLATAEAHDKILKGEDEPTEKEDSAESRKRLRERNKKQVELKRAKLV